MSANTIDEYINDFPDDVKVILHKIRKIISQTAPDAKETINYGIPTFKLEGNLVHFAGYKNHIGFYPTPSGIEKFKDELSAYENSKGPVKFLLKNPIPYDLIKRIVEYRVKENLEKVKTK
jgi:uncharacterized protein YdhG (YjbR/CyaY superfamily)